ncbi:MAG: serine/threonine-protein kinase [bacterium]
MSKANEEKRAKSPPEDDEKLVGVRIDGRYEVIRPLAVGGMGSIYLASQRNLKRDVAIKVVSSDDEKLLERFRREAEALAMVSHPAIVEIHDFVQVAKGDRCYLIMAYIDGKDLSDYLDELPQQRLPAPEVVDLMLPIASALVELHANGIIHRDLKPANVVRFLRADGHPGVKLVDFGIARKALEPGLTATGFIMGTPPYMAPEVILGKQHSPLADVYAFGATLFELLTGRAPFGNDDLHSIMKAAIKDPVPLPEELKDTLLGELVVRMLDKDEELRPDALQVLKSLEEARNSYHSTPSAGRGGRPGVPTTVARPRRDNVQTAMATPLRTTGPARLSQPLAARATPVNTMPTGRKSRRAWVWIASLATIPLIALIIGLVLAFGDGDATKRPREKEQEKEKASAATPRRNPTAHPRPRPRPVREARRVAPAPVMSPESEALAEIQKIAAECKESGQASALITAARKAAKSRRKSRREYARRVYHALLRSGCTGKGQRRWIASLLASLYIRAGQCQAARSTWRIYRLYSAKLGQPATRMPACR